MKKSVMVLLKNVFSVTVIVVFIVFVSGCRKEGGTMEKAGEKVDRVIEDISKTVEKAKEKTSEGIEAARGAIEKAGEKASEGVERVEKAVKKTAEKVEEKIKK